MNTDYTNREKTENERKELDQIVDDLSEDNMPTANIIVAGITGAGKSTLVNTIFGEELAKTGIGREVTDHMQEYDGGDIPIHIWDTVGLVLDPETTRETINDIKSVIARKARSKNSFDRIHAIWYCINSGSHKYQGAELDFVKELHSVEVPFIIVLTQCIGEEEEINDLEKKIREINASKNMDDIDVVQVLAKDYKIRGYPPIPAFGLDDLVDITLKKLPDFIKKGFVAAQTVSRDQKRIQCEEIIARYIADAKRGFWDKVPLINIGSANKKIMKMFRKIGFMYNVEIPKESIEKISHEYGIDFENVFFGLIAPNNNGYYLKVNELLEDKKLEGFTGEIGEIEKNERVALMIAFYGYTFISAIEETWKQLTKGQMENIDMVVDTLMRIVNEKIKEKLKKKDLRKEN